MSNRIKIDSYVNGFKIEELSCSDRAIAAAAGSFHTSNYYFFGLLCAMEFNWTNNDFWGHNDKQRWLNRYNNLLLPFGLEIEPQHISNSTCIIKKINELLEKSYPVIMLMPYYAIPWDERYFDETQRKATHIFLITENNTERCTYIIRDDFLIFQHNEKSIMQLNPNFNHSLLWRHQISKDQLLRIWEHSNQTASEEKMYYADTFFSMKNKHDQIPEISNFFDLYNYIKNKEYNINDSRIARLVTNFNQEDELKCVLKVKEAKFGVFRRNYVGSIHVVTRVMGMMFEELSISKQCLEQFYQIMNSISEYRSIVLYKMQKKIWREQRMSLDEIESIVSKMNSLDNQLLQFIKEVPL